MFKVALIMIAIFVSVMAKPAEEDFDWDAFNKEMDDEIVAAAAPLSVSMAAEAPPRSLDRQPVPMNGVQDLISTFMQPREPVATTAGEYAQLFRSFNQLFGFEQDLQPGSGMSDQPQRTEATQQATSISENEHATSATDAPTEPVATTNLEAIGSAFSAGLNLYRASYDNADNDQSLRSSLPMIVRGVVACSNVLLHTESLSDPAPDMSTGEEIAGSFWANSNAEPANPISTDSINANTRRFTIVDPAEDLPIDDRECAICKNEMLAAEQARALACSHVFHEPCIDNWLLKFSGTCPMCRAQVNTV